MIEHSEGNICFHTAAATVYPFPAPGHGDQPAPVKLPENNLLAVLGFRTVEIISLKDTRKASDWDWA
ncbi:3',5'-cyclic AMP phosphodiesterase CpdA [Nostoc flagelliforme CCNUN1]|uniref:3',5'-cyclic AMP phosphodiesterase CpdA n=1 Tax=Nostoc flagelliforme CCNUN1 TaxID=2038116 RepID=A0A2K8T6K6_9NOSO|nr:3',5'-cyclic AMP phosphodiesterase CpdA [Nostoc flagelliforme CCNUN1]